MIKSKLIKIAVFGGAALLATSCETISEDQCFAADWADKGYSDGANGQARSSLNDYIEACSKFGADVDRSRYLEGYESGLTHYCTYDTGFSRAEQGNSYTSACSGPLAAEFRRGYEDGARNYCTYDRGFDRGEEGSSYKDMCEGPGTEAYRRGYSDGHARYEYEREYDGLLDDVRKAKHNVEDMTARLTDTALDADERFRLEKKLRRFKDRLKDARWELRKFERKRGY